MHSTSTAHNHKFYPIEGMYNMTSIISGAHSRPGGVSFRSKMYERYDVKINTPSSGGGDQRWFNEEQEDVYTTPSQGREIVTILQSFSWKARLISLAVVLWTTSMAVRLAHGIVTGLGDSSVTLKSTNTKPERPFMDPDSHKRNNPFAPAGHVSVMEGVLEVKRIGGGRPKHQEQQQQMDAEKAMNITTSVNNGTIFSVRAIDNHQNPSQMP